MTIDAVLFDLDGTLLDTAPDLASALNRVLAEAGRPTLPLAAIRPYVSHGAAALVRFGFAIDDDDPGFAAHRARVLDAYTDRLCEHTTLYPGIAPVLDTLEQRGLPWGVVTNKPSRFTDPLMAQLGLDKRSACTVSGDTAAQPKPHPAPLLYAAEALAVAPARCLYVGDAQRDIEAGNRAGMRTLAAAFGYLAVDDDASSWHADGVTQTPAEILDWL